MKIRFAIGPFTLTASINGSRVLAKNVNTTKQVESHRIVHICTFQSEKTTIFKSVNNQKVLSLFSENLALGLAPYEVQKVQK